MEEKFLDVLRNTALFRNMAKEEIKMILTQMGAVSRQYDKGETICRAGECAPGVGVVLSGSVCIENHDAWGNKTILDRIQAGQVFAESYACVPGALMMVSAVAAEKAEVFLLHTEGLFQPEMEHVAGPLIRNLLLISAQKNLQLSRKIFYTASKSIRGRLQLYLSDQATRLGTREFEIPFDRQQLADYLGVDRSALSHEFGKMQKEGLLQVRKNYFCILEEAQ